MSVITGSCQLGGGVVGCGGEVVVKRGQSVDVRDDVAGLEEAARSSEGGDDDNEEVESERGVNRGLLSSTASSVEGGGVDEVRGELGWRWCGGDVTSKRMRQVRVSSKGRGRLKLLFFYFLFFSFIFVFSPI